MDWLADSDVAKLKVVSEMPVIDFFMLLNKKIAETKIKIAKANKG